jgi:hypothetical protein
VVHSLDGTCLSEEKYHVHEDDVYNNNMDEKGVALGVAGKQRVVIISKAEKKSLSYTSGGTGRIALLESWPIFKGVRNLNKWHNTMEIIGLVDT